MISKAQASQNRRDQRSHRRCGEW